MFYLLYMYNGRLKISRIFDMLYLLYVQRRLKISRIFDMLYLLYIQRKIEDIKNICYALFIISCTTED